MPSEISPFTLLARCKTFRVIENKGVRVPYVECIVSEDSNFMIGFSSKNSDDHQSGIRLFSREYSIPLITKFENPDYRIYDYIGPAKRIKINIEETYEQGDLVDFVQNIFIKGDGYELSLIHDSRAPYDNAMIIESPL